MATLKEDLNSFANFILDRFDFADLAIHFDTLLHTS